MFVTRHASRYEANTYLSRNPFTRTSTFSNLSWFNGFSYTISYKNRVPRVASGEELNDEYSCISECELLASC